MTAAALDVFPGATIERVETDAHGAAYGAHLIDVDGNPVNITFDEELNVVETRTGMPGGRHGDDHEESESGDASVEGDD